MSIKRARIRVTAAQKKNQKNLRLNAQVANINMTASEFTGVASHARAMSRSPAMAAEEATRSVSDSRTRRKWPKQRDLRWLIISNLQGSKHRCWGITAFHHASSCREDIALNATQRCWTKRCQGWVESRGVCANGKKACSCHYWGYVEL